MGARWVCSRSVVIPGMEIEGGLELVPSPPELRAWSEAFGPPVKKGWPEEKRSPDLEAWSSRAFWPA